jgi:hypothetical protein
MEHAARRAWGRRLIILAGLMPFGNGLALLVLSYQSSTAGFQEPWISVMGQHGFRAVDIATWNREVWAVWKLSLHMCGANVAMSGASILTVAFFGLRDGQRWAWYLLLALFLWHGGNDIAALVAYRLETGNGIPIAILPTTLGIVGLILAGPNPSSRR